MSALIVGVQSNHAYAQSQVDRPVVSQRVLYPHSNGYQLGDLFEHTLQIVMMRPYSLVVDSLPSTGRVSGYIELQNIAINKKHRLKSTAYLITLQYQVINHEDGLVGTSVPPVLVSFSTDSDVYPVVIEPWGFTLSPFLMSEARNYGAMPPLEPLAEVTEIPLSRQLIASTLLLLGGVVFLLPAVRSALMRHVSLLRNRPFTKAHRNVQKITREVSLSAIERSLRCLHQAFSNKTGRTILSEDVDSFLLDYPEYSSKREDINRFFRLSDQHFFSTDELADGDVQRHISFIRALSSAMRRAEWKRSSEPKIAGAEIPKAGGGTGNNRKAWLQH